MPLFLVVGGACTGKKSLVNGAAQMLAESKKYIFPKTHTTRVDATKDLKTGVAEVPLAEQNEIGLTGTGL